MSQFTVNTLFTDEDLKRFYATGTNVVVAKPTQGSEPNVAWVVYRPLLSNNLTWKEEYGIYASNVEIQNGATLRQMSQTSFPADDGKIYELNAAGVFEGPNDGGRPNIYTAQNDYDNLPDKGYLTIGLYQNAEVNGIQVQGNAVSAAPVMYKSKAEMTTYTTVYLWTQSQVRGNTVVTDVTSAMTEVRLSGDHPEASLRYDATTGTFVPASGRTLEAFMEGASVRWPRDVVAGPRRIRVRDLREAARRDRGFLREFGERYLERIEEGLQEFARS